MAHSANIIKKINLGGTIYEIHDEHAIHTIEDIQNLGLEGVFQFKGTVASLDELPEQGQAGHVYHVTESGSEYVWVDATDNNEAHWEEFGTHIIVDHVHDFNPYYVHIEGTNEESEVTGSAVVTGSNSSSAVTGTGSVSVPKVSKSANYIKATSSIGEVSVGANGTANAITGFGAHTTAKAITALNTTTIKNPSVTPVSIPNITGNANVTASKISENADVVASKVGVTAGSAANWGATVDADGVLSFTWNPNTPTAVTAIDVTASKITASDVNASKVTLGTALSASNVSTADVTVATGANDTADAITALGTPTTAAALTGVKVTTQPTLNVALADATATDGILVGDTVAVTSEDREVSITGTAAAQIWTQATGTITGTAAAQTWDVLTAEIRGTTGAPYKPNYAPA